MTAVSQEKDLPFEIRRRLANMRADRARFVHGLAQIEADRVGVLDTLDKLDKKEAEIQEQLREKEAEIDTVLTENGLK